MGLFAGIDVAKDTLAVALSSGQGWSCANNARGIALLVERLEAADPALVVLEATGGYEEELLATEILAIHPNMKVLFMSAYSIETAEDYNVRLAPGEPFLGKPFSIAGLQRTVRYALDYEAPSSPHLIQ